MFFIHNIVVNFLMKRDPTQLVVYFMYFCLKYTVM